MGFMDMLQEDAESWADWDSEHQGIVKGHGYKVTHHSWSTIKAEKKDAKFHHKVEIDRGGSWSHSQTQHSGFTPSEKDKMKAIRQMGGAPEVSPSTTRGIGQKSLKKHLATVHKK